MTSLKETSFFFNYYRSYDVVGGAVAGAVIFTAVVVVIIIIACKKQAATRGRVVGSTTVTTVHQQPPPPPMGNIKCRFSYSEVLPPKKQKKHTMQVSRYRNCWVFQFSYNGNFTYFACLFHLFGFFFFIRNIDWKRLFYFPCLLWFCSSYVTVYLQFFINFRRDEYYATASIWR